MDADDDMWTPTFKESGNVRHTALMKKLARFRTNVIYAPVEVLHPVLPVAQYPVVQTH
jgi:hypothetical protein